MYMENVNIEEVYTHKEILKEDKEELRY